MRQSTGGNKGEVKSVCVFKSLARTGKRKAKGEIRQRYLVPQDITCVVKRSITEALAKCSDLNNGGSA